MANIERRASPAGNEQLQQLQQNGVGGRPGGITSSSASTPSSISNPSPTTTTTTTTTTASSTEDNNTPAQPPAGSSSSSSIAARKSATTTQGAGQPNATSDGFSVPPQDDTTSAVQFSSTSIQPTISTSPTPVNSATPLAQLHVDNSNNGVSTGTIAAAVIVPILVLAFIFAVFFLLSKRRRRRRQRNNAGFPQMKERSTARDNANGTAEPFVPPILTSNTNTAYYTGLDTGSDREHSGEFYAPARSDSSSFAEPPPPYKAKTHDPSGGPIQASAIGGVPVVRLPTGMPADPPSPDSWATAPRDAAFLDTGSAFGRSSSRAPTVPSINSDLYSDEASIHSARAARRSVGGANVISQANVSQDAFNPFDDPSSPVSSVDGDEDRSFTSAPSRAISPVSFRSRS